MRAESQPAATRAASRRPSCSVWQPRILSPCDQALRRYEIRAYTRISGKRRRRDLRDAQRLAVLLALGAQGGRIAVLLTQLVARRPRDEEEVTHGAAEPTRRQRRSAARAASSTPCRRGRPRSSRR